MKNKKVLIVDFDDKSIGPLTKFLEEEGFAVLVERDGEAGLETAKKQNPDLVILEPMLPKLHGFELCSIITHDLEPKIPVIILTKFYREEQFKIESVRSFGASAFVCKPFQGADMRELIKSLLVVEGEERSEENSLLETDIPDTLSDDALENLKPEFSEDPQMEEAEMIEREDPHKERMKSGAESPQEKERTQERVFEHDFDSILQDTLTEFTQKKTEVSPAPEKKGAMEDPFLSFIPAARPAAPEPKFDSTFPDLMPAEPEAKVAPAEAIPSFEDLRLPQTKARVSSPELPSGKMDQVKRETSALQPDPEEDNGNQHAIFQKFDLMAQASQPSEPIQEFPSPASEVDSPDEVLQQAAAVTQTLEKELEIKVGKMVEKESESADEIPKTHNNGKNKKNTEKENSKARATKSDVEKPAAGDKQVGEKTVPVPSLPDLKDVVEKNDMFAGFGSPDEIKERPKFIQSILAKIKGTPTKYIVPIAAVIMIVLASLVFMIPKLSKDAPLEQATLGTMLEGQTKSPPVETTSDPIETTQDDFQDTAATPPPTSAEEENSATDPVEAPEPKPKAKSTPPPNLPQIDETIETPQVKSQLIGNTTPQQTQNVSNEPPREQDQSTETPPPAKENLGNATASDPTQAKEEAELAAVMRTPETAKLGDIVSIKAVDTQPEVIQQELPRYPAAARGRGISGTVLVNTLISENGDVLQTVVTRKINSIYGFNEAAERAVKKWKFRPAWKDGVRVKVWKTIPIAFRENSD